MEPDNSSQKTAQSNFFNWASLWTKNQHEETPFVPDVIEVVTLFQIMGFTIKFFDSCDPNDCPASWKQKKGLKVNITCGHTGLRCVLENEAECKCPENVAEAVKSEISGTKLKSTKQDEILETDSDILLPVSNGNQFVISSVLNHLFHMVTSSASDSNQNEMHTPASKEMERPELLPSISPSYHRSMDNLIDQTNPEMLTEATEKPLTKYSSSPDVYSLPETTSRIMSSLEIIQNEIYKNLNQIQNLIEIVKANYKKEMKVNAHLNLHLIQEKGFTEVILSNQPDEIPLPIKACINKPGSTPNLNAVSRIKSAKPTGRPRPISAAPVTKSNTLQTKVRPVVKDSNNSTSSRPPQLPPKSGKYSHIQSTIPKFTLKKKNVFD